MSRKRGKRLDRDKHDSSGNFDEPNGDVGLQILPWKTGMEGSVCGRATGQIFFVCCFCCSYLKVKAEAKSNFSVRLRCLCFYSKSDLNSYFKSNNL